MAFWKFARDGEEDKICKGGQMQECGRNEGMAGRFVRMSLVSSSP